MWRARAFAAWLHRGLLCAASESESQPFPHCVLGVLDPSPRPAHSSSQSPSQRDFAFLTRPLALVTFPSPQAAVKEQKEGTLLGVGMHGDADTSPLPHLCLWLQDEPATPAHHYHLAPWLQRLRSGICPSPESVQGKVARDLFWDCWEGARVGCRERPPPNETKLVFLTGILVSRVGLA